MSSFNAKIFKAYDIRGVYPEELDEVMIYKIGKAYITYMKTLFPDKEKFKIVVGRDMRVSSPSLAEQLIQALLEMGADVLDIGLVSSPTFYFEVSKNGYDGGLQVSASHNPKEYNGVKVVRENSIPIGLDSGLDKIRDFCFENSFIDAEEKGVLEKKEDSLAEVIKYSKDFYDFSNLKKFKVVADAANAMGALDLRAVFDILDSELVEMNFTLDGTFPAHEADPMNKKNILDLRKRVVEENADLGIATDGDSDRIFFIDNKGEYIDPSIIRGMLAKEVLKHNKGATICYDVRPGRITRDMIVENGGKPVLTKVGHSLIKKQAIELNSPFAGESSGHFFFKTDYGTYEMPSIVIYIMLKEISESEISISEIIEPLKRYVHSGEINTRVKDVKETIQKIKDRFEADAKESSTLDGITIEYEDYWFNVRGSNTQPLIRLNLEAIDEETMVEKRDLVMEVINEDKA